MTKRVFTKPKSTFGTTQFWRIKKGEIQSQSGSKDHLQGHLERVNIVTDPGNPQYKIKAHDVIEFVLKDDNVNQVVQVATTGKIAATYTAQALNKLKTSQYVALTTSLGDSGVTFVNFFVEDPDSDGWLPIKFKKTEEDFDKQMALELEALKNHPMFGPFRKDAKVAPKQTTEEIAEEMTEHIEDAQPNLNDVNWDF